MILRPLLVITLTLVLCSAPAWSQDRNGGRFPDFDALEQDLDWVQWVLENSRITQSQLDRMRQRTQTIVQNARDAAPEAKETVESLNKQLEALGPPPEQKTNGPESSDVAAKRRELQEKLAVHQGYLRRIELIETRGEELISRIANKESQAAAEEILSRERGAFDARVWWRAADQVTSVSRKVWGLGISTLSEPGEGYYTLLAAVVLVTTLLLRLALLRLIPGNTGREEARYVSALIVLMANGFMPAAGLFLAFLPLIATGEIEAPQARLMESILAAVVAFLITRAWIHVALFSFQSPRLIKLNRRLADPLARRLYVLTGVVLLSFFLYQMGRADITEPEFYHAGQLLLRILIAALFFWTLPIVARAMQHVHRIRESPARIVQGMYGSLYFAAWVAMPAVIALNPLLLAAGFWRLADWLFFGVTGSGLLLLTLWLIRNALRELVSSVLRSSETTGSTAVSGSSGLRSGAVVWLVGLFNLTIWLGAILCLLVIWGIPYSQIVTWTTAVLFTEVSLAEIKISMADIVVAVTVFVVLLTLTRVLQRQLQKRLLAWAPLDAGVRNALWSVTGYIGILAAGVTSLLALGVNLSQLVIILGALSVGIGFGLQSIVHDFFSGLILLLERPVRIGDWIEVDGEEGSVERIGARTTLIRTDLDRDIWIPNSRLASGRFTNRTLRGDSGYIRVVSPLRGDTDEKAASELILNVAAGHPDVLSHPEPEVVMDTIDGEVMELTLHAVIGDISRRRRTESDLRFALKPAFREAGIKYANQDDGNPPVSSPHGMPQGAFSASQA